MGNMEEDFIIEGLKKHFHFDSFKSNLQKKAILEICQSIKYIVTKFLDKI